MSKDAFGDRTSIEMEVGGHTFSAEGLEVTSPNYLEIYPYEPWKSVEVPEMEEGEVLSKFEVDVHKGTTTPPPMMHEAELISIMDKNGIGTDATIHQHIKTVKDRGYVWKQKGNTFKPTVLGASLVNAYKEIGVDLYKPRLRAQMESDMKAISKQMKTKDEVVKATLSQMEQVFDEVKSKEVQL
mmetsp:Transcript_16990/g.26183  ORF Transcript_16990/g.26183 Transcript_16990/m.26183 type:complete len:184 (+) Transcript_16990:1333-1884(+)